MNIVIPEHTHASVYGLDTFSTSYGFCISQSNFNKYKLPQTLNVYTLNSQTQHHCSLTKTSSHSLSSTTIEECFLFFSRISNPQGLLYNPLFHKFLTSTPKTRFKHYVPIQAPSLLILTSFTFCSSKPPPGSTASLHLLEYCLHCS